MWETLQYLRLDDDCDDQDFQVRGFKTLEARFMGGYFEFVVTKRNRVKFLDYKVNETYFSQGILTCRGEVHSTDRPRGAF